MVSSKDRTISLQVFSVLTAAAITLTPAGASEVGETPGIARLRAEFIAAVKSNDAEKVGELVSSDYVMLQPNQNGPDTYGKSAYINYRKSLDPVAEISFEIERVITCGDWAFEIGKEYTEWKSPQINHQTMARFVRVLNRAKGDNWQYARTIRAISPESYIAPPKPGSISNYGYGTWMPRSQSVENSVLAQEMMDTMTRDTRALVASGDMVSPMSEFLARPDKSTGELIGYGASWELHGTEEYMAARQEAALTPYDDLRKYHEEGIVCEPDTGFLWGQDLTTGKNLPTGERWISSGDYFYMMKKQDGKWRMGPVGVLYDEVNGAY